MYRSDVLPWLINPGQDIRCKLETFIDDVLLPESIVETSDFLPQGHLDALVDCGLLTIVTASNDVWNVPVRFAITEQVAFGCLDTWFVITQHWGASGIVKRSHTGGLALFWDKNSLIGVGFGHLRRGVASLKAEFNGAELSVSGFAPWVTGSGWLSWVVYGATLPDGNHIYFRLPHTPVEGYCIGSAQSLAAVRRTDTREVTLDLSVATDYVLDVRPSTDLSNQDEVTLVTSMAPILGLIARCLYDWNNEVKPDNRETFERLADAFRTLRTDVYALLADIGTATVSDRVRMRQDLHVLLETVVHVWSLSSGGQSNSAGMLVIRRRQEAAFFRVFQQTKMLKDAAISSALSKVSG
jgi:hypothetical protein